MAEKIKIEIDAETRQAISNLAKLQAATDEVTKSTTKLSLAQKTLQVLNTDLSKLGGTAGEMGRNVATGVAAGIAGFAALAYKATELAAAIEQQDMAINRLGSAYDAVRAATNGVVSAQEALKAQQTLVQAGLRVNAEQLATITRAAREYARATGTETTQALEQLTDALRTGSGEGLGRFGVSLQQGVTGARAFTTAMEQLTTAQERQSVSSRTLREDLDKLPEGLMALGAAALRVLEGPADRLTRWLTGLAGASTSLRGLLSEFAGAGDTLQQRERQQATDAAAMQRAAAREQLVSRAGMAGVGISTERTRGFSVEQLQALQRRVDELSGMSGLTGTRAVLAGAQRSGALGQIQRLERQGQIEQLIDQMRADIDRGELRAVTATPTRRAQARAGTPDTSLVTAMRNLRAAQAEGVLRNAPLVSIGQAPRGTSTSEYIERLTAQQRMLNEHFRQVTTIGEGGRLIEAGTVGRMARPSEADLEAVVERERALAQSQRSKLEAAFENPREARARERRESLGGRALSALGIATDEEGNIPAFDALQVGADMLGQSLGTLRSGFAELFNTLASGSMSAGEAFQQFAAKTLKSLGEMSINQGIALTFQGIAALFTNPVAAPLMLAGGAGLIALGTGLGAAGAAAAPSAPPSGGAATSAARSASGVSPRSEGGGAGNVTIVLSSLVPPGPRELQGLVHAQRQAGRYGLDDARMVPRQVRA